jgi:hypothetical protein
MIAGRFHTMARLAAALLLSTALAAGASPEPGPAAPAAPASAAAGSDALQRALVGHWRVEGGRAHYYFGATRLVMVDDGDPQAFTYAVLASNDADREWTLRITTPSGGGHVKALRVDADGRALTATSTFTFGGATKSLTGRWVRVDDATAP